MFFLGLATFVISAVSSSVAENHQEVSSQASTSSFFDWFQTDVDLIVPIKFIFHVIAAVVVRVLSPVNQQFADSGFDSAQVCIASIASYIVRPF